PINLDNVIYYCPLTKKLYFEPFGAPGSHDLSTSVRVFYSRVYAVPLNEVETLLASNKLAEEVTIDSSNKFDIDFLNTSSERDVNVAILNIYTASRELLDNISSSDLGQGGEVLSNPYLYTLYRSVIAFISRWRRKKF
ncbi:hypothetical protein N7530_006005, partial [Penicillium desertorum]